MITTLTFFLTTKQTVTLKNCFKTTLLMFTFSQGIGKCESGRGSSPQARTHSPLSAPRPLQLWCRSLEAMLVIREHHHKVGASRVSLPLGFACPVFFCSSVQDGADGQSFCAWCAFGVTRQQMPRSKDVGKWFDPGVHLFSPLYSVLGPRRQYSRLLRCVRGGIM